jgi:type I restriction enzyme, S subunit
VGGANIVSGTGQLVDVKTAEEEQLISGKFHFTEADVLYSKIRPYLRKAAIPGFTGLCSADIYPLRPNPGRLDPQYLCYLLLSDEFTEYAIGVSNRAGMPKVNRDQLFAFECALPSVAEQQRIARVVRECLEQVGEIQALRMESQVIANSLLSAHLNEIANKEAWKPVPLSELLADTQNGRSIRSEGSGNGAVLTLSAVRTVRADLTAMKHIVLDDAVAQKYAVQKGNVFVSRSNTRDLVGLSSIVVNEPGEGLIFPDLLIRLSPRPERLKARFLAYGLRFPDVRRQIQDRATGSAQSMVKISSERLREVQLPLPPLADQERVADELEAVHEACVAVQASLLQPEVDHMRSAILRKAFSRGS